MQTIITKTYFPIIALLVAVLAIGFIRFSETIAVNVHDVYFVARRIHLSQIIAVLLLVFMGVLLFSERRTTVNKTTILIYAVLTFLSIAILYCAPLFQVPILGGHPKEIMEKARFNDRLDAAMFFSVVAFVLFQIWFTLMLIYWALIKK